MKIFKVVISCLVSYEKTVDIECESEDKLTELVHEIGEQLGPNDYEDIDIVDYQHEIISEEEISPDAS